MHNHSETLAIDIGNTRTHLGLISSHDLSCLYRIDFPSSKLLSSLIPAMESIREKSVKSHFSRIVIACGINSLETKIASILKDTYGPILRLKYSETLPLRFLYPNPLSLGADRIADALYGNFVYPGSNLIIIDAGTAITADLLIDSEFRGGVIFPGIETQLKSLHTSTGALPEISSQGNAPLPAINTEECIRSGVLYGIAGALNHFVLKYGELYPGKEFKVLTTGGSWPVLDKLVSFQNTFIPDLTLTGISLFK